MITLREVATASRDSLYEIKSELIIDKMKLDKFFSVFLDENEMEENNLDTPEWFTYREMLKNYDRVNQLLKTTDFYIGQHARSSSI